MKYVSSMLMICAGLMVSAAAVAGEGPDSTAILGQISSNYDKAISDEDDSDDRHKLKQEKQQNMSKMSDTLGKYNGSSGSSSKGKGFYEVIRYRDNDPFLFCTDGQDPEKFPDRCWWPIAPYTGAFMMNPACDPPNPYGKEWTEADWDSLGQYLSVCPMAGGKSGPWKSKNGEQPNMVPYRH